MKRSALLFILMVFQAAPITASAVEPVDFEVKTTKNLLNLCTASPEDGHYAAAVNFCHGYLIGAYHYHAASKKGPNATQQICVPEPEPSRNESHG